MVIMENYFTQDQIQELWLKIDRLHFSYLEMEESSEKINQRTKLEDCIAEFLCVVSHKHKFTLPETGEVLYRSAAYKKDFSGYRAATGWNALQMYAGNLWTQPWRKEYRQIKTYCGFYKHQIEANLIGAEKIFEMMGYKHIGNGVLTLEGPVCPDIVAAVSRDCLVAYVECQILKHMWEEVSTVFNISWLEVLEYRRNYSGSPEQCVRNLKCKFNTKQVPEPIRNQVVDTYDSKYHPASPPSQISMPISHNYIPGPSHNHVALPVPSVPYYMPAHTNGCPNAFATYGYAPCNAHIMPVVKQPLPAVVAQNGYFYPNGFPMVSPGYPVPTGQLIEIESRNGYDMVDGSSTTSRVRRTRTNSSVIHENDRSNRTEELPKNGLGVREDEKQDSSEDWDYVYRNLERQGYSKDLGERGDVLGLSVSDKQRKHSKETKKVKATNLDEAINNLSVNDRPLKMTEALERMDQKSVEKVSQPRERRHSQGSSYENVVPNEVMAVKAAVKPTQSMVTHTKPSIVTQTKPSIVTQTKPSIVTQTKPSIVTQTKPSIVSQTKPNIIAQTKPTPPKEKSEKDTPKVTDNVEPKKDTVQAVSTKWECKSCTYLNAYASDICEICSKSKNIGREQPMEVGGAECSKCTLVNPRSAKTCQACSSSLKDSPTYI